MIRIFSLGCGLALSLLTASNHAEEISPKLVCAGGVVTEIVSALGAEDHIVAIDSSSAYPAHLMQSKPVVGYVRALPAEGIISTGADTLLTLDKAGPAAAIEQIDKAGINVIRLTSACNREAAIERIEKIGALLGKKTEAQKLIAKFSENLDAALADAQKEKSEEALKVLYILHPRDTAAMIGGAGTSAQDLITLIGAENAAKDVQGWKMMNAEGFLAIDPDLVIVGKSDEKNFAKLHSFLKTTGVISLDGKQLLVADHGLLLGFGPRLSEAVRLLTTASNKIIQ